ncbi:MAG: thioredoxin family protein [Tepidisphaeraceae bacterium]
MTEQTSAKDAFKPVWFIGLIVLALAVVMTVARMRQGKDIIPWRTDLATARDEAARLNKPVFLYFTASWCGPCQELKHTTWADADVEAALRAYVPVKIDIDQQPGIALRYDPDGIVPFFVATTPAGDPLKTHAGALPPDEFLKWLKG